jgi:hypothetical protein
LGQIQEIQIHASHRAETHTPKLLEAKARGILNIMMLIMLCRRWIGIEHQLAQNKTNVLLHGSKPSKEEHKVNICNTINERGQWTNEALEETMDVIQRGTTSLKKASKQQTISLILLLNHLNGKTRFKKYGLVGVLTKKKL